MGQDVKGKEVISVKVIKLFVCLYVCVVDGVKHFILQKR